MRLELLRCKHCSGLNLGLENTRIAGCGCGAYSVVKQFYVSKKDLLEIIKKSEPNKKEE